MRRETRTGTARSAPPKCSALYRACHSASFAASGSSSGCVALAARRRSRGVAIGMRDDRPLRRAPLGARAPLDERDDRAEHVVRRARDSPRARAAPSPPKAHHHVAVAREPARAMRLDPRRAQPREQLVGVLAAAASRSRSSASCAGVATRRAERRLQRAKHLTGPDDEVARCRRTRRASTLRSSSRRDAECCSPTTDGRRASDC